MMRWLSPRAHVVKSWSEHLPAHCSGFTACSSAPFSIHLNFRSWRCTSSPAEWTTVVTYCVAAVDSNTSDKSTPQKSKSECMISFIRLLNHFHKTVNPLSTSSISTHMYNIQQPCTQMFFIITNIRILCALKMKRLYWICLDKIWIKMNMLLFRPHVFRYKIKTGTVVSMEAKTATVLIINLSIWEKKVSYS